MRYLCFFVWGFWASLVQGETVYVYPGNLPISGVDGRETVEGIIPSLISAAFDRVGIKSQFQVLPFKRALAEATLGRGLVAGIISTPERRKSLQFSAPIFYSYIGLITRQKDKFQKDALVKLHGKAVGTKLGFRFPEPLEGKVRKGLVDLVYGSHEVNLERLLKKRISAIALNLETAKLLKLDHPKAFKKLNIISFQDMRVDFYLAGKKGKYDVLIEEFNRGFQQVPLEQRTLIIDRVFRKLGRTTAAHK
ncbi:substrate-binding periplasmic protein [Pseudobacteriovorax antillogorgiicola]|uniref:ABC-type amino acid transport substrate-binding protein n=1 Tax=Pseudobacteriovorax antillogorgiicola TaxID=1513793 RepID=A0A1Y6C2J6_9BACT|nr:transporter substrate-binding domain-containing protein [Pseudobacteriovorax antillogorgiicola]TCS50699.1 ABC-type amino acid transport substrate-binding protein [Pseudobacteriovorax antillogorgiicola]SMF40491.1 ABC-type amino acid transport substrate-binding protein [Pseudobacteriovorax antillogorgiicola]